MAGRRAPGPDGTRRLGLCSGRLLGAAADSVAGTSACWRLCGFSAARPAAQDAGSPLLPLRHRFALLAGAKLAVYIHLFGYTPRRVVAGWFLGVLAVWAVLLLVRVFRSIPAARMGLAVLAVTFVLLSCVDMKSRIVRANLDRYAAGVDADLDLDVACRTAASTTGPGGREQADVVTYTRWLLDAGWLKTVPIEDLQQLYDIATCPRPRGNAAGSAERRLAADHDL